MSVKIELNFQQKIRFLGNFLIRSGKKKKKPRNETSFTDKRMDQISNSISLPSLWPLFCFLPFPITEPVDFSRAEARRTTKSLGNNSNNDDDKELLLSDMTSDEDEDDCSESDVDIVGVL